MMAERGSKPGERRGGRQKGTPNKASARRETLVAEGGATPLDYLLSVMRDENRDGRDRLEAAKAAAPYVHPKLAAMTLAGNKDAPPVKYTISWMP
jgi:hypothetical protein